MIPKIDVRNPSVCRSGRWKRRRSVNAVSMARWEYLRASSCMWDGFVTSSPQFARRRHSPNRIEQVSRLLRPQDSCTNATILRLN